MIESLKVRILKAAEKEFIIFNESSKILTADFISEATKSRRHWAGIFKRWRKKKKLLTKNFFYYYFILFFFYFTILYWFCHTSTWIHHKFPLLNPPPTSLPIPSLWYPSAPTPSTLYPALNLDWRFVSYMILYMFQCHSPKSSHPLPLPQSAKDCSIHLCLFCYLAYRVIVTIFINSIYMC